MIRNIIKKAFSTSATKLEVYSPYSNQLVYETGYKTLQEAESILESASKAQKSWSQTPLDERILFCKKIIDYFEHNSESIARNITLQMGKPLLQSLNEIKGMNHRIRSMIAMAPNVLEKKIILENSNGYLGIEREPVGNVLIISPWNYPLLTTVNTLIPSILAGNSVLIKHSPYTPFCGEVFQTAAEEAGVKGIIQNCMVDIAVCQHLLSHPKVNYVSFTGSVNGGKSVYEEVAESGNVIDVGLELGGKDGFYVAADADLKAAVDGLIDGAMYNAGQSCCSVERIFVHKNLYEEFLEKAKEVCLAYKLGDPLKEETTMGPLTLSTAPEILKTQIEEAVSQDGKIICGGMETSDSLGKGRFFEPTIVANPGTDVSLMVEESFGPIVGVVSVDNDEEAIKMINDCKFGLTGGVYSKDRERAIRIAKELNVGTVFMNRCDFLEPKLPWSGRKLSGKGVSLSEYGFHVVTRTKGYNFKF